MTAERFEEIKKIFNYLYIYYSTVDMECENYEQELAVSDLIVSHIEQNKQIASLKAWITSLVKSIDLPDAYIESAQEIIGNKVEDFFDDQELKLREELCE